MRLLITGGSGFLGSALIRYFLHTYPGYDIINLDRLAYTGNRRNLAAAEGLPMYHFVHGDVCNEVEVAAILAQGVDAVIHLASEPDPDPESQDPSRFIRTDLYGTYVLVEAAQRYPVDRFVFISSADVYGQVAMEAGRLRPASERDELLPVTSRAAAKVGAERLAYASFAASGLPLTVVRPSAVYGPHQYPDRGLSHYITQAIAEEPMVVPGVGGQVYDWLSLHDFCRGIDAVLHARKREVEGEVFNLGTGAGRTLLETVEVLLHFLDRPKRLVYFAGDQAEGPSMVVDADKLQRLGWRAQDDVYQALPETIRWYQEHPEWWGDLRRPLPSLPKRSAMEEETLLDA